MQGLPYTYRDADAEPGTTIKITINGAAGGDWFLTKQTAVWVLDKTSTSANIDASVSLDPNIAWKLFTKGITPQTALETAIISGQESLSTKVLYMISVIA